MKRFYASVAVAAADGGWRVTLDGRPIKTQGGGAQVVPARALAEALAAEWAGQGPEIDASAFRMRDMVDHALDVIGADRAAAITALLRFAETDTLCYRAGADEPLAAPQQAAWEPLLAAAEARWDIHFTRVSGVLHQPQPEPTLARLRAVLEAESDFTLAALTTLASLAASLVIALAALAPGAEPAPLWDAANFEEDWQAQQWGHDAEADALRARKLALFSAAFEFAQLVRA